MLLVQPDDDDDGNIRSVSSYSIRRGFNAWLFKLGFFFFFFSFLHGPPFNQLNSITHIVAILVVEKKKRKSDYSARGHGEEVLRLLLYLALHPPPSCLLRWHIHVFFFFLSFFFCVCE